MRRKIDEKENFMTILLKSTKFIIFVDFYIINLIYT